MLFPSMTMPECGLDQHHKESEADNLPPYKGAEQQAKRYPDHRSD
jgi:hypothetical protein